MPHYASRFSVRPTQLTAETNRKYTKNRTKVNKIGTSNGTFLLLIPVRIGCVLFATATECHTTLSYCDLKNGIYWYGEVGVCLWALPTFHAHTHTHTRYTKSRSRRRIYGTASALSTNHVFSFGVIEDFHQVHTLHTHTHRHVDVCVCVYRWALAHLCAYVCIDRDFSYYYAGAHETGAIEMPAIIVDSLPPI